MELRVIYDNEASPELESSWGFSCLIDGDVLFDMGGKYRILRNNMELMGISPSDVGTVVISHDHWDHMGGLSILEEMGEVNVIIPGGSSQRLRRMISKHADALIVEVKDAHRIREGIDVIGDFGHSIDEIVVVVEGDLGKGVITGCAHPGLDNILAKVSKGSSVSSMIGGFHDFNRLDSLSDLELIIPCHCTELKYRILEKFPETSHSCKAGDTFQL